MSIVRQDAWTNDEDLVLAEVVLRHIREGSTQLAAFEEVGERLSRTAAACGFRWNSSIRKNYDAAIAIAKKQRKNLKKSKLDDEYQWTTEEIAIELTEIPTSMVDGNNENVKIATITIDDVIHFLVEQKDILATNQNVKDENNSLAEKLSLLTKENERLTKELSEMKANYEVMKQDHKLLIDIMDRAKQLSALK